MAKTIDGVKTRDGMVFHNIQMTSETLDIRGINAKTLILDNTFVGTFPSQNIPGGVTVSQPVKPTLTGDIDVIETLDDGTAFLTRIRHPVAGARVLYPVIEITWAWTAPY